MYPFITKKKRILNKKNYPKYLIRGKKYLVEYPRQSALCDNSSFVVDLCIF